MTFEQIIQISDWCKENRRRIQNEEWTQTRAAQEVFAVLGFEVPVSTLQHLGKIAKIKWSKSPPPPAPVPIDREAIIILMGAISGLYIETGRTVPENLANLQSTYASKFADENEEM
jgi:hypothetical protein